MYKYELPMTGQPLGSLEIYVYCFFLHLGLPPTQLTHIRHTSPTRRNDLPTPQQPLQLPAPPLPHQLLQPPLRQEIVIAVLKPGHHRLANQQPPAAAALSSVSPPIIPQQETRLVLPPLHNPLQPLPGLHIGAHHKTLHPLLLLLVRVDHHVRPPAPVVRVNRARPVAVEAPLRRARRQEVEDARRRAAQRGRRPRRRYDGGGAVCLGEIPALHVRLQTEGADEALQGGGLGGG